MHRKWFLTCRKQAGLGVFVLCFIVAASVVQARSIYVSTEGDDNNTGTYFCPFKTIQKAADTLQTGDSGCVLSGHYKQRVVINNVTATKEKPVLFKAIELGQDFLKFEFLVRSRKRLHIGLGRMHRTTGHCQCRTETSHTPAPRKTCHRLLLLIACKRHCSAVRLRPATRNEKSLTTRDFG